MHEQQQLAVSLPDGQQQQCLVHNRQAYCSECAGIIADMCPFTPGPAQQQQHSGRRLSGQLLQQQQQHQQQRVSLSQQQPAVLGHCSVCGKQLGRPSLSQPDGAAVVDAVAGAVATPLQVAAGVDTNSSRVKATAAPLGPLEAGTLGSAQQQQQQQQAASAAAGFAASKAWVAAAGAPAVLDSAGQQAQFDAIAAAVSGFDSAAATAAAPAAAESGAAHNGINSAPLAAAAKKGATDDRWANWQNVVAAIKSASSGPLAPSNNSVSAGVGEAELASTASDPVPQMQEVRG
jgi:hypothetical protein